jgi:hypothetical protein
VRQEGPIGLVSTKKAGSAERPSIERPSARGRAARSREKAVRSAARHRGHSLAPEHVGEAGSVAVLALSIIGLSIFIAGIAMAVFGLTTAARYGSIQPPNVNGLGLGQVLGGAGLAVLGVALLGSGLAVLADIRGSRMAATVLSAIAAVLSAIGVVRVMTLGSGDPVLAGALAVGTIILAAAAIILARRAV